MIHDIFRVHRLNDEGLKKAEALAETFTNCLREIEAACGEDGREMAIVRTKLQEASYFAKRAITVRVENQVT